MTSVYGVTFVGARMQIFNRLKERGTIQEQTEMYRAACYAAKVRRWALKLDAMAELKLNSTYFIMSDLACRNPSNPDFKFVSFVMITYTQLFVSLWM